MNSYQLFSGIDKADMTQMLHCMNAQYRDIPAGKTIFTYQDRIDRIAVLQSGSARIYTIDPDGTYSLIELLHDNDVFGEMFTRSLGSLVYIAQADEDCRVMFLSCEALLHQCANTCSAHRQLLRNLLEITSQKMQQMALHINILTRKTVRQKLLTYLEHQQQTAGSSRFRIDMTLSDLAIYLNADRSSLMRELRHLKAEGYLESSGRNFRINKSVPV